MEQAVAVIGTGVMGAAIAKRLLATGWPVTVWNRTPEKCSPLAAAGARVAPTAKAAIEAADVAILVTMATDDVIELFDTSPPGLGGKDVVNLITGTPNQVRALGERVGQAGGFFLSGTIQCYPSGIGGDDATFYLGGAAGAWQRQEALLRTLAGAARYLGENVALPNVVDAGATGDFFFTAMGACLEATSYAAREGVPVAEFRQFLSLSLQALPAWVDGLLDAVERDELDTADATIVTFAKSLDRFRVAFADAGASDTLMAANHHRMQHAIQSGDGEQGFAALSRY